MTFARTLKISWTAAIIALLLAWWCSSAFGQTVEASDPAYVADQVERFETTASDLQKQVDALTARVAALESGEPTDPVDPPPTGPVIDAPDTYPAPGLLTVTIYNAKWASAWTSYDNKVIRAREVPADGVMVFDVKEPGRIVISADPNTDRQVDRPVILTGNDSPAPGDTIRVGTGDDWQKAWDRLPDGGTLEIEATARYGPTLILRDKTNATVKAVHSSGERASLPQGVRLAGRLTNLHVEGLALVNPDRDPYAPGFDPLKVKSGEPMLTTINGGFRAWIDGLTLRDCVIAGGSYGVVLTAYNPANANYDGEFIRGVLFDRCIIRDNYTEQSNKGKRSSGYQGDRVDGVTFRDTVVIRNGWNPDVLGAGKSQFNQGVYYDANNGPLTLENVLVADSSFCSVQMRSHAKFTGRNVVGLRNSASMFFSNGTLDNYLLWMLDTFEAGGQVYGNSLLDAQDGPQSGKDAPVVWRNGLIAEHNSAPLSNRYAIRLQDAKPTSDDGKGPPTKNAYAAIDGLRVVGFDNPINKLGQVVSLKNYLPAADYGPYRNPATWPGGIDHFLDVNRMRPYGAWDETKHGAGAMLNYTGVTK